MDGNNKIEILTLYDNPDGDIYPEKDLPENARLLRGFVWRGDERIKTKEDIYPEDEVELDRHIVDESNKKYKALKAKIDKIIEVDNKNTSNYLKYEYKLEENPTSKYTNTNVSITLSAIITEDDVFQIFYSEDGTTNYNEENSTKVIIKGSPVNQKITFYFPNNSKLKNIRIDPGENPNQKSIKINSFEIKNKRKFFKVNGNEFFKYFNPNDKLFVNKNKEILILNPKARINGKVDPMLLATEAYILLKIWN